MANKETGVILIVDDEAMMCELCTIMLNNLGYKTISFLDGLLALNWFKTNSDKVIIALIDMVLPFMDGLELKKDLLLIRKDLKVVWMSAYMSNDKNKTIGKPFDTADLAQILKANNC